MSDESKVEPPKTDDNNSAMETKDLTTIGELSRDFAGSQGNPGGHSISSRIPGIPDSETDPLESAPAPAPAEAATEPETAAPPSGGDAEPPFTPSDEHANAGDPLAEVRRYAEQAPAVKADVAAAFPFSLLITGEITPEEREKLLDILSRENMGIREVDLEPQFQSGKILIPRISEYAGVLLIQALRATRAKLTFGPSDSVFATEDTRDESTLPESRKFMMKAKSSSGHPAESMPVTTDSTLPDYPNFTVVDVITATASIKSTVVEAESSAEYQEIVEALQRELRYKAYHKGALGILNYSVELTSLHLPSQYRVSVSGTAIRAAKGNS
ncbi:MAG TPA: hypothetical protein VJB59_01760 [Bdellovibrionota bacterium]|nr:hypothetical protein [Bdellovibrionota bacterium]